MMLIMIIFNNQSCGRRFGFLFILVVIFFTFLLLKTVENVSITRLSTQQQHQIQEYHSVDSIIELNNNKRIHSGTINPQRVIKRDTGRNFCGIVLVLDNSFLARYDNNRARAIKAAEFLFNSANAVFLNTTFSIKHEDVHYRGYGNTLVRIEFDADRLFHNPDPVWKREDLEDRFLRRMDEHYSTHDACLTYLLTDKNILDKNSNELDGFSYGGDGRTICYPKLNVGVVSIYFSKGTNYTKSIRTLAHEFAHSWGAPHDQHDPSLRDGDFLMTDTYASAPGSNNMKLSPLSNIAMAYGIQAVAPHCFIPNEPHCGNLIVEFGEECDSGLEDTVCCTKCKLNPGAQCSPVNEEFCTGQCTRPEPTPTKTHTTLLTVLAILFIVAVCAIYKFIIKPYFMKPTRRVVDDGVDYEPLPQSDTLSVDSSDSSFSLLTDELPPSDQKPKLD